MLNPAAVEYARNFLAQGIQVDVPAIMLKFHVSPEQALEDLLEAKKPAPVQEIVPVQMVAEETNWAELDREHAPVFDPLPRVPQAMKHLPQWLTWSGDPTRKQPFISGTLKPARTNDAQTLVDYKVAADNIQHERGYKHLGFLPANDIVGLDIDGCRDPQTGEIKPWAQGFLDLLPHTYVELTPSKTGLRPWIRAEHLARRKVIFSIDGNVVGVIAGKTPQVELLTVNYGCMTGESLNGCSDLAEVSVEQWNKATEHLAKFKPKDSDPQKTGATIDDKTPVNTEVDGPVIPYRTHDNTLYRIACSLRARGWEKEEIYEHLVKVCETRCEGYGRDYLDMCRKKAESACKKPKGEYGFAFLGSSVEAAETAPAIPVQPLVTELTLEEAQKMVDQANEKLIADLSVQERKIFQGIKDQNPDLSYDTVRKMVKAADISTGTVIANWRDEFRNISQMEQGNMVMIIDGVLQEGVAFIGASAGDGKTLIALAMAKAIVLGQPLFGIAEFLVRVPRNVIYLIPESSDKPFRDRCHAFKLPEDDRFLTRTISSGLPLSLDNPLLLEAVRQTRAVVFLDTVSRFITSEDENSAAQNRVLVDNIIALRAAGSPCVVVLHHAKKSGKEKGEAMTLENMLRGTGDYAAMCDTVYGIRADDRLRANGSGPLEMDIVNLKDREQVGGLAKLRLAASYKKEGSLFPVSYISETGNLKPVDCKQTIERIEATLIQIVEADPKIPTTDIMAQTGLTRRKVTAALEGRGWHIVKGGTDGHSPWHQDKGQPCPFDPHILAAKAKKSPKAEKSQTEEPTPAVETEAPDIPY
jgi:hypothetical protein